MRDGVTAQGIPARRAETTGSAGTASSQVPKGCAQDTGARPTPMKEDVGTVELLPCPFCSDGGQLQVQRTGAVDEWWHCVFCDRCCTYGPTAGTEAEAIAAWNTRTPPTKGTPR